MAGSGIVCDTVSGPDNYREKKRERKRKNLIRLGINPRDAFNGAGADWGAGQSLKSYPEYYDYR